MSREFFGERGYMGYSLFTFEDCLLELYHNGKLSHGRKIKLLNSKSNPRNNIKRFLAEVKEIFLKYNFLIEE